MGRTYWILVWDRWGDGLNMVNPRFLVRDDCPYEKSRIPVGHENCPSCLAPRQQPLGTEPVHRNYVTDSQGVARNSWPMSDEDAELEERERAAFLSLADERHLLTAQHGMNWKVITS